MILQEFLVFILLSSNLVRITVEAMFGTSSYQYYDVPLSFMLQLFEDYLDSYTCCNVCHCSSQN
jgi:hypothetical protein